MVPLSHLFERINFTFRNKVNAPMFVWSIYHDSNPPFIGGHAPHKQKHWHGITIDEVIPTKAIDEINSISSIEARASCQGTLTKEKDKLEVPTYFIFRPGMQNVSYIESIVKKLNKYPDIKSGYGMGQQRKYRIAVIGDMSYDTDPHSFKEWWNNLAERIKASL
jgi:hypothetical protein